MSNNPPGWYADPFGRAHVRWWSGSGWTDHVATNGQEFIDPPGAGQMAAAPTAAAPAAAAQAVAQAAPAAPVAPAKKATQTLAIVGVVALVVGALAGWFLRGDGDGGGGGGGGGGAATNSLATPILQGLASLNTYEYSLVVHTVGPTASDRTDATTTGAIDNGADLRHLTMSTTTVSVDDPEGSMSSTESWRNPDGSCTFDGEEYTSDAANPFEADLGTVLSGVFDLVIPAGNATLVGDDTVAGVAAQHWTFSIQGLGAGTGAQVSANQGDMWVAADGGYLLRYQVTISMQSAPTGTAGAESYDMSLDFQLTTVNQPVTVQMPAACPAPGTTDGDTISG